eukprot:COSAG05_NODE_7807_length_767_cov_1.232036_1_plen_157_part_10
MSMIGSEASWRPPKSDAGHSEAPSVTSAHEPLLRAQYKTVRPKRNSIQSDSIRLPMRVHLERLGRKLKWANVVLLPLGIVAAVSGGICHVLVKPECPATLRTGLFVTGGVLAGIPIFLDLVYAAALAPYAVYNAQSTKDPLSCGPRRFTFPSDSVAP